MGPHVLVVDTDSAALATMDGWLKAAQYETTTVSSFLEGRAALDTEAFDLLIAAVRLGAFNGIHLVILARHRAPDIRTIVTHSKENGSLEQEARRAGAHAYLRKPVPRWAFLSAVEAALHADENCQAALRRWPRQTLSRWWQGKLADAQARVIDVSYGGVRVEMAGPESGDLGSVLRLDTVEPAVSVQVRPVWARESPLPGIWWFGAELADQDPVTDRLWRATVDSVASDSATWSAS